MGRLKFEYRFKVPHLGDLGGMNIWKDWLAWCCIKVFWKRRGERHSDVNQSSLPVFLSWQ
jgi:hypothetical protein